VKQGITLVATMREPGIYVVGDKQYNESEFQELSDQYENTITFVPPNCQKLHDNPPSNLNIEVDSEETANAFLRLRGIK
jgi:hypothetical protein